MKEALNQLREVHAIQGRDGCWDIDDYMLGLYNGLELALSIAENRECRYKQRPKSQLEQEPVAFASHGVVNWIADKQFQHEANLYIAPQRTWVDLTRAQFAEILCDDRWQGRPELMLLQAQSKLKEKNTRGQE